MRPRKIVSHSPEGASRAAGGPGSRRNGGDSGPTGDDGAEQVRRASVTRRRNNLERAGRVPSRRWTVSEGVASRRGKVDELPELAAAEAEAPVLKLSAISGCRDGAASALTPLLKFPDLPFSYAGGSLRPHAVCRPDRMYFIALFVFLGS